MWSSSAEERNSKLDISGDIQWEARSSQGRSEAIATTVTRSDDRNGARASRLERSDRTLLGTRSGTCTPASRETVNDRQNVERCKRKIEERHVKEIHPTKLLVTPGSQKSSCHVFILKSNPLMRVIQPTAVASQVIQLVVAPFSVSILIGGSET